MVLIDKLDPRHLFIYLFIYLFNLFFLHLRHATFSQTRVLIIAKPLFLQTGGQGICQNSSALYPGGHEEWPFRKAPQVPWGGPQGEAAD